ncbi:LPXTG cell wall anchor domain-containing protein [Mesorhizobium sp. B2-3-3]|uniref:LAETG motif-containing sortase-dependent surface protein n=1 Tax=Streptomyces TaxID=1883 RepID=UPI00106E1721|nr:MULTISPECIES: LAETG motif-containing sortase-dependent surface protein [Streptomyces]MDX2621999.1 LPXTG cell wall anchor domain-containing protein [Streptomyces sp. WI03-5b]QBR08072.1 LPXTG cell wall anchor domain-containing protein [Streptomyces sp. S501]TPN19781.1 LPXTG cell wall anchor domain-containing protein [Mesorhizobium sp. B2-3-3]WSK28714.1 LPXTG cell wall anchor domain-containing protein [[Kitasatospora] papulosa]
MKLRRTLALAAATAVIGPVVLLSAPAAFAQTETTTTGTTAPAPTETPSGEPSAATPESTESASQTATTTPSETESPEGVAPETVSPAPTATESETASAKPTPTASETEDEEEGDDEPLDACEPRPLELSINGLSGKIARGSGWDRFTFTIYNDSKKTVKNVAFFAGAAADEAGEKLFTTKQVRLQALNEADGTWEDIEDLGSSSGYVGEADGIKPGYEVDIDLRLKVEASAPVGAGFSLGGGLVFGDELEAVPCFQDVAYKFQIVDAGNGGGAEPQEGGKIPVPTTKPAGDTAEVTGNLAETGSSSSTPAIALAGGAAVVLGAGAMFVVRRRRNGDAAA